MPPITIREVPLTLRLPSTQVGMVLLQPHLSLSATEPYRITAATRASQLDAIRRTLSVAQTADHGAGRTHFTLIPEYSTPGIDGINLISESLAAAAWPTDSVVMAGVDALTREGIATLLAQPNTVCAGIQRADQIPQNNWVNCFITWVKGSDGVIRKWIQPKIQPAWAEATTRCDRMFRGTEVFVFSAEFDNDTPCRFAGLVCYDWIGEIAGTKITNHVLGELNTAWQRQRNEIHWLFVLKHNRKPNHREFLAATAAFFEAQATFPRVNREYCAVVMANTAATVVPSRSPNGGSSSISFAPNAPFSTEGCPPTVSFASQNARGADILARLKDVVLRESGACIHSVAHHVPAFRNLGIAARAYPIELASVHPLILGNLDPRLPAASVPAAVKWTNDALDTSLALGQRHVNRPLSEEAIRAHRANTADMRILSGIVLERRMQLSTFDAPHFEGKPFPHVDSWGVREISGLNHVLDVLDILRTVFALDITACATHGLLTLSGSPVEVVAIAGPTHRECRLYADKLLPTLGSQLTVLITRDADNTNFPRLATRITEPKALFDPFKGPKITAPGDNIRQVCFQPLLEAFINSSDSPALGGQVNGLFTA